MISGRQRIVTSRGYQFRVSSPVTVSGADCKFVASAFSVRIGGHPPEPRLRQRRIIGQVVDNVLAVLDDKQDCILKHTYTVALCPSQVRNWISHKQFKPRSLRSAVYKREGRVCFNMYGWPSDEATICKIVPGRFDSCPVLQN